MNQVSGDVHVFAPGHRNPYDIILHSNGYLYASDNGGPERIDEINLVEQGRYYGYPNLNRCRFNPPECVFVSALEPSNDTYNAPIAAIPGGSSCNGLVEYASDALGGLMQGDLLCGSLGGDIQWARLSDDGRSVESVVELQLSLDVALDLTVGPDGTIYGSDGTGITYLRPVGVGDKATATPTATLTRTPVSSPTPQQTTTPTPASGDADCDGSTDSKDALIILQYSAGLLDDLLCLGDADMTADGVVNSKDATVVLQCSVGLIACGPASGH